MARSRGNTLTPRCPYCGEWSEKVGGEVIYPSRRDLHHKRFYLCSPCNAYVGCHPGTDKPLGRLADAALRREKSRVHRAFDPLWRDRGVFPSRTRAYKWLGRAMGLPKSETHIGLFDLDQCRQAVALCVAKQREGEPWQSTPDTSNTEVSS